MNYVIQCRFSKFLIQLCIKKMFFGGPCRNITTMCRKIAFYRIHAETLPTRDQGFRESCAGRVLGPVKKY